MKNKYQKLHRIVIGISGSGKSFYILSNVKEDNKINIICYPETIGTYGDVYRKAFPGIFLKYRQDVITAIPQYITNINEKFPLFLLSLSYLNRILIKISSIGIGIVAIIHCLTCIGKADKSGIALAIIITVLCMIAVNLIGKHLQLLIEETVDNK